MHLVGVEPGGLDARPGNRRAFLERIDPAKHVPTYRLGGWRQFVLRSPTVVESRGPVPKLAPAPASMGPSLGELHGDAARVCKFSLPHDPVFSRELHHQRDAGMPRPGVYPYLMLLHTGLPIVCRAVKEPDGERIPSMAHGTS